MLWYNQFTMTNVFLQLHTLQDTHQRVDLAVHGIDGLPAITISAYWR
jgi:hypothetical protein